MVAGIYELTVAYLENSGLRHPSRSASAEQPRLSSPMFLRSLLELCQSAAWDHGDRIRWVISKLYGIYGEAVLNILSVTPPETAVLNNLSVV